jgi:hypothetical protein
MAVAVTAVEAEVAAFTVAAVAVWAEALITVAEVAAATMEALLRMVALDPAAPTAATEAAQIIIPAHPITIPARPIAIPVLHLAGRTVRWAVEPATAIAPAIAQA